MKNANTPFNSSTEFDKSMVEILYSLLGDRLTEFLEFCMTTHNATPLKEIVELLNNNKFGV